MTEVTQEGNQVWSKRKVRNEVLSDYMYHSRGIPIGTTTTVDRWIDVRWDPPTTMWWSLMVTPSDNQGRRRLRGWPLTLILLHPRPDRDCYPEYLPSGQEYVFQTVKWLAQPFERDDDLPMLQAVQNNMVGNVFWDLKAVLLTPDVAVVRVRRVLDTLIADDQVQRLPVMRIR